MALGQVATEAKSTEIPAIPAIPALLCQLELEGAEVTIDAMGYQQAIAEQVIAQKGDYIRPPKAIKAFSTTRFEISSSAPMRTISTA